MLNQPLVESNHSDRVSLLVQAPIMGNCGFFGSSLMMLPMMAITGRYNPVKVESDFVSVAKHTIAENKDIGAREDANFAGAAWTTARK
jgi:hypothetical protein